VVLSGSTPASANLALGPQNPLPDGATITTTREGTQSLNPFILNTEKSTINVTGCPNGYGFEVVAGVDPGSGQLVTDAFPLAENPTGSGKYQATIPPLSPIHGEVEWSTSLNCLPDTALYPNGGTSGGGTQVTINGFGFTGTTAVEFGSVPAESFQVLSDSQIEAVSPSGTGVVDVTVVSPQGTTPTHAQDQFTYNSVSGISPTSGPEGTPVTIDGSGFSAATSVFFGSQVALGFTVVSDTQITAIAPPGQVGTVDVQVFSPDNGTSTGTVDQFTYSAVVGMARSQSSSLSPSRGGVLLSQSSASSVGGELKGAATPEGGGTGTGTSTTTAQLVINGQIANTCAAINALLKKRGGGSISCGGVGTGNPNAEDASTIAAIECLYYTLLYRSACPGKPGSGYVDPSGTVQDTNGNPVAGATVTVLRSDTAAGPFVAVPSGNAEIEPPTNPETSDSNGQFAWDVLSGYYEIQATKSGCANPGNSSQSIVSTGVLQVPPPRLGLQLTLDCGPSSPPAPSVSSDGPTEGPTSGGTLVTLTGSGLNGATAVQFGAAGPASFTAESPTTVVATSPVQATAGPVNLTITTPVGTTGAGSFTYLPPPSISSLSPSAGPTGGGTPVTMIGNFGSISSVTFGSVAAQFVQASPTELIATTPPGSGSVQITVTSVCPSGLVTTICGVSGVSGVSGFTYGALGFSSATSTTAFANSAFSFTVTTFGGTVSKLKKAGKLPKGVKFTANGNGTATIAGTPTGTKSKPATGTYYLTITATFGTGKTKQVVVQSFTLTVS